MSITQCLPEREISDRRPAAREISDPTKLVGEIPDHWSREKKIEELMPIAHMLRRKWRWLDRGQMCLDPSDIYQTAAMAIVKAVDEYDPARGVQLGAFAMVMAKFAVRDYVRANMHASRRMQEQGQNVRWLSFNQPLRGGSDTLTLEDYLEMHGPSNGFLEEMLDSMEAVWERNQLQGYIARLPERERYVMERYVAGVPMTQICSEMNLSSSRAYAMLQEAMKRMQRYHQRTLSLDLNALFHRQD